MEWWVWLFKIGMVWILFGVVVMNDFEIDLWILFVGFIYDYFYCFWFCMMVNVVFMIFVWDYVEVYWIDKVQAVWQFM